MTAWLYSPALHQNGSICAIDSLNRTPQTTIVCNTVGQKNKTKVIRLLAKNTIEEVVVEEQNKSPGSEAVHLDVTAAAIISLVSKHPVISQGSTGRPATDSAGPSNA